MASGGGERRMVFDIRGRRRHAVKVVYAILAVLMGASLFLVVGPVNIGELFNSNSGGGEVAKQFEEQAQRIERKLAKDPENPDLLLSLMRSKINAGNGLTNVSAQGQRELTPEGLQAFEEAGQAWSEYLKASDEPGASAAQLMAPVFFTLAEVSTNGEVMTNLHAAAQAQEIVAKQRPTLNSLSTLAIYKTFNFDYAGARKVGDEAKKYAANKFQRENIDNELEKTKERAEAFQASVEKFEKQQKKEGGKALEGGAGGLSLGGGSLLGGG